MQPPKILIYDLELAPIVASVWTLRQPNISINQIVEPGGIICFGYRWYGEKKSHVLSFWDDGYENMIDKLWELFDEADVVCGFNSIGFDDKHTKAAFFLQGLTPPSPFRQIDLYRVVRKHMNLPSRKLDYIAQALGIGKKTPHSGMAMWNEVMRPTTEQSGDKARKLMAKYCAHDVDLTTDLYDRLLPWIDNGANVAFPADDDKLHCTSCGSDKVHRRGWAHTAAVRYRRYQCQACGRWMRDRRMESTTELRPA